MPDYTAQMDRLRSRLGKPGGASNKDIRAKLEKLSGRQYFYDQRHQQPTPIPYSGAYDTTVATATDDLNQDTADIAGRRLALKQQYGIGDDSNPYSLARQLETQYKQNTTGTNNSYAASGQLYAGSLTNAQNANRSNFGQAQDSLLRQYQAADAGLTAEQLAAERRQRDTVADAEATRLEDALNTPVDPAEAAPVPEAAKALLQRLQQRAQDAKKAGKDNQADKIRDRLQRLRNG